MTSRNTSSIPLAPIQLEAQVSSCDGYLLGSLRIGAEKLHVEAIRVAQEEQDGGEHGVFHVQMPYHLFGDGLEELEANEETKSYMCSCGERFRDLEEIAGAGTFTSQKIPGHSGDWVLYATPYMT